jgi:hypothetical protein
MLGCTVNSQALKPQSSKKIKLKPVEISNIKKIAIVTSLDKQKMMILDHTEIDNNRFGADMYGVLFAFTKMFNEDRKNEIIKSSLSGDKNLLVEYFDQYPVKAILDSKLVSRFSKAYEVPNPEKIKDKLHATEDEATSIIDHYIDSLTEAGADTFLYVSFNYGLAVYIDEKSSVALDAEIRVYNVKTNELLVKKFVSSDTYYRSGHTVNEFLDNDAKLLKMDIIEAADGLALRIATEFGLDIDQAVKQKKGIDEILRTRTVTCNHPYPIEQDCTDRFRMAIAQRKIVIKDIESKVAGSNDGKIILITGRPKFKSRLKDMVSLNLNEYSSMVTTESYELVRKELISKGFNIVKIIKLRDFGFGRTTGYIIEVDGDGYSALKPYSK